MVTEDFVLALLVIAAAAAVVPFVEWLFKRHTSKVRGGPS